MAKPATSDRLMAELPREVLPRLLGGCFAGTALLSTLPQNYKTTAYETFEFVTILGCRGLVSGPLKAKASSKTDKLLVTLNA